MNIIIPIMIAAVVIGLTSKRLTGISWFMMSLAIVMVIARYYVKN